MLEEVNFLTKIKKGTISHLYSIDIDFLESEVEPVDHLQLTNNYIP